MDSVEPLHPYWVDFAAGCLSRGNEAACWLALLNGTNWNIDPKLEEFLNKLQEDLNNDPVANFFTANAILMRELA